MIIKRIASLPQGTFGVLIDSNGEPFALTCERPWLNNRQEESCIPVGSYTCKRIISPKFGETFIVTGVKGRSNILFHRGNIPADSKGCILIGEEFGRLQGQVAVLSSQRGFEEFMQRLGGAQNFNLDIMEA